MVSQEVFPRVMSRSTAACFLLSCLLGLAVSGCELEPATAPVVPGQPAPSPPPLVISELRLVQKTMVGAEYLDVDLTVEEPGSETIAQYGLRTPYGEKIFTFKPALTVIPNGKVSLKRLGPPEVGKTGPMTLELWLIDDAGNQSNALSAEVTVQ